MKDYELFAFAFCAMVIAPLAIASMGLYVGYLLGLSELGNSLASGIGCLLSMSLLAIMTIINNSIMQAKKVNQLFSNKA